MSPTSPTIDTDSSPPTQSSHPTTPPILRLPTDLKLLLLQHLFEQAQAYNADFSDFLAFSLITPSFEDIAHAFGLMRRFLGLFLREECDEDDEFVDSFRNIQKSKKWGKRMVYLCALFTRLQLELRGGSTDGSTWDLKQARLRAWSLLDLSPDELIPRGDFNFIWSLLQTHSLVRESCWYIHMGADITDEPPSLKERRRWRDELERIILVEMYFQLVWHHPLLRLGGEANKGNGSTGSEDRGLDKIRKRTRSFNVEIGKSPDKVYRRAEVAGWFISNNMLELVPCSAWEKGAEIASSFAADEGLRTEFEKIDGRGKDAGATFYSQYQLHASKRLQRILSPSLQNFSDRMEFAALMGLESIFTMARLEPGDFAQRDVIGAVWKRDAGDIGPYMKRTAVKAKDKVKEVPPAMTDINRSTEEDEAVLNDLAPIILRGGMEAEKAFVQELGIEQFFSPLIVRTVRGREKVLDVVRRLMAHRDVGWVGEKIRWEFEELEREAREMGEKRRLR